MYKHRQWISEREELARLGPAAVLLTLSAVAAFSQFAAAFREHLQLSSIGGELIKVEVKYDQLPILHLGAELQQILALNTVHSVSATLTRGKWYAKHWGPSSAPAAGAVLLATLDQDWHAAWETWEHLANALGAQLCASLNLLAADLTHTVQWTTGKQDQSVLFGQLPQEALCVENLGHWLQSVPSEKHEGLKKLLRGARRQWFNAPYLSLQLSLTRSRESSCWQLSQTMTAVVQLPDKDRGGSAQHERQWGLQDVFLSHLATHLENSVERPGSRSDPAWALMCPLAFWSSMLRHCMTETGPRCWLGVQQMRGP
ncbi:hypothetical protein WJX73_005702 [Symbiochloris irregularis]|uniref:Uncharacterized protein n=1 Tax=Symbiochloris irregularis TaxID=706552 RepID=A0AAW1PLV3_9CHLO